MFKSSAFKWLKTPNEIIDHSSVEYLVDPLIWGYYFGVLWNSKVLKCHFDVVVVETLTAILFVVR